MAMNESIVKKLAAHLNKQVNDEPSLVYLLAEVRKLLEREDKEHHYGSLWMYCHWALHVDLTRPGTTRDFLERIDRWATNNIAYLEPSGTWESIEEHYLFQDLIFLDIFRRQLREFLAAHDLPLSLCEDDDRWNKFLAAYGCVIEDGTLSTKAGRNSGFKAVKHVVFRKGKSLTTDHHVPFVIEWHIHLNDERILQTEVQTIPTTIGRMTAHSITIVNGDFIPPS
jgi:hypothetical protein